MNIYLVHTDSELEPEGWCVMHKIGVLKNDAPHNPRDAMLMTGAFSQICNLALTAHAVTVGLIHAVGGTTTVDP